MILYTITTYPPSIGGAQAHTHAFAQQIATREDTRVIYQWDTNRTDWLRGTTLNAPPPAIPPPLDGIPLYRLSLSDEGRRRGRFWVHTYRLFQGTAIARISEQFTETMQAVLAAHFPHPPRLIHNVRVGREGLSDASWRLAQRLGVPFVLTPNHHPNWRGWLYRHWGSLYRRADALIAYSEWERKELVRLGVEPHRIHVLGIAPLLSPSADGERFRRTMNIPPHAPLILFLGQKYAYKGLEPLLHAAHAVWEQHPAARFVFLGPRTSHSAGVFRQVSDPQIIERDSVDLQTKTDALAACDVLCVPSSRESFGGVYIEAGALGKPVIAGDAPAVTEIVREDVSGYCVHPEPTAIAARLTLLLSNPSLGKRLGEGGREIAAAFTWEGLAERLWHIYEELFSIS